MLYIRTQDRMRLVPLDKQIYIVEMLDKYALKVRNKNKYAFNTVLGIYATEERALEVLDEIEKAIIDLSLANNGGINVHTVSYVYQMPKE